MGKAGNEIIRTVSTSSWLKLRTGSSAVLWKGHGGDVVLKNLDQMISHISHHFDTEEEILNELKYPDYNEHSMIHKTLIEKTLRFNAELETGEVRFSACISFILDEVIMDHLIKEDTKFFEYTRGTGK